MTERSIKKNYVFNLMYQLSLIIVPFITTPYISRALGADGIGKFSFASSIAAYFSMLAIMGTGIYGQREISYVRNDKEKMSTVFWNMVALRSINTLICLALFFLFVVCVGYDISFYSIISCNILVVAFDISWLYQALEDFKKIAIREIIFRFISVLLIFLFVNDRDDLEIYVAIMLGLAIISALSLWAYVPQVIQKVSLQQIRPWNNIKVIFSLFIPTIAIQIYTVLDKTMIGFITASSYENGYYEQAMKISKVALAFVSTLGVVMVPRIGHYFAEGRYEEIQNGMYRGYRFVWFLGIPLCLGLIGVSDNMVPWFYGAGYEKVAVLLKILALLILSLGINNVTGIQYLIPTQREKLFTKTVCIGAAVNFILNSCLIPSFGSVGAAVASVAAETSIAVVQIIYVRKELSWKKIVFSGWKYYVSGALMLVLLLFENKWFEPSIISSAIMIVTGAALYFICLLILKDSFFIGNMKSVLKKRI